MFKIRAIVVLAIACMHAHINSGVDFSQVYTPAVSNGETCHVWHW